MTSNIKIPKISKVNKMAETGFRALIGKRLDKQYKFMGVDVKMSKLSVEQVMEIQELAASAEKENKSGFELVKKVIRMSVEGTADVTDEEFNQFPMDELSKLSSEIMKFSGLGAEAGK